jgi:hypothetical protein
MRVDFSAEMSSATFKCCGTSTSDPSFGVPLLATSNNDGGGTFELEVPADAPIGSYAMKLVCATQPNDQAFQLEINDALAPVVSGIDKTEIAPGETLVISGEHLDGVSSVTATRRSDGAFAFCDIDQASQTAGSISCSFSNIQDSADATDVYVLDVSNETCGSAVNRPTFLVTTPTL